MIILILKMLEPMTFPKAISWFPLIDAKMFTAISGDEVPKATTVSPITIGGMPKYLESFEEEPTNTLAPIVRRIRPSRR